MKKITATQAPIVFFEWGLGLSRHPGCHCESHEIASNNLHWFGDIGAHLGYAEGEFGSTWQAWCEALHPDDRNRFLDVVENHLLNGEPYFDVCRAERRDGSWLEFTHAGIASYCEAGHPWKLTGTLTNFKVPDAKSVEEVASTQHAPESANNMPVESLLRTAAYLNAQLDLGDVCEAICAEAARTLGAPSAVMLFSKTQDAFVPTALRDMPRDYGKRYIPTSREIYQRHVADMGTLFLFDEPQSRIDLPNRRLYHEVDMRTIGVASLIREDEVLGLLKVYSFGERREFDENELALLQGLADQGAQAISNAQLYAKSQRRLANLQSLRQVDIAILSSTQISVPLDSVIDQVVTRLGDAATISLLDAQTGDLSCAVERGFRVSGVRRNEVGQAQAERAALERQLIYVADINATSDFTSVHDTQNEGFVSYYAVPMVASGQVKGVLELWNRAPRCFDEEELEFLETLAGQAAIAVEKSSLFHQLQCSNDELIMAYDSTLEGWSGALDLRDKETEGHSQRVTSEALRLAEFMGLDDAQLINMRRGALLHDIGKMGVPDAILLKTSPLSNEEWIVMKKHPTYARELLWPITYLRPALDIPYSHHEKWDGTGYPQGLKGEQIPLAARIFAIVDVWDALSSERSYRKGWPQSQVLEHILTLSGTHFDPQVVTAFLKIHQQKRDIPLKKQTPDVKGFA